MATLLVSALVGAKAITDALRPKSTDNIAGVGSPGNPGSRFNDAPTDPLFDAYQQGRRGTGAHDMTINRPLAVKRFPNPILKPMRDYQRRVVMRRQVGPETATWIQHMIAEALPPDPPFFGDSKSVAYNRRLVIERMPRIHKGLTVVDREPKEWNALPMNMYYHDGVCLSITHLF